MIVAITQEFQALVQLMQASRQTKALASDPNTNEKQVNFALNMMNFALNTMNFALKMMNGFCEAERAEEERGEG